MPACPALCWWVQVQQCLCYRGWRGGQVSLACQKKKRRTTLWTTRLSLRAHFFLLLLPCKSFAALSLAWATVRLPPRQTFAQVTPRGPPPAFCIPNAAFSPNTTNLSGNKITRKVSGRMGTDVTETPTGSTTDTNRCAVARLSRIFASSRTFKHLF